ncbi:MAG TPA: hypothetical protein VMW19_13135 [Myxococcota bacterium]|nr:hypothetical protein [Myxococcota bacterium]
MRSRCHALLRDEPLRREIAAAGRARCIENATLNERIAEAVLQRVSQGVSAGQLAA